ncbi:MAG: hypothetical protein AAGF93_02070 [Cyanobacteria bacterium P01_H01_bin.105]
MTILKMQSKVQKALIDLARLRKAIETKVAINKALLRNKAKQPKNIKTVLNNLGEMPTPNDKTHVRWLDTAFKLADKADKSSSLCFESTNQLINFSSVSHKVNLSADYLSIVNKAESEVQALNNHFLLLLELLPEEVIQESTEKVVSFQDSQLVGSTQRRKKQNTNHKKLRGNNNPEKLCNLRKKSRLSHVNIFESYKLGMQKMLEELKKSGDDDPTIYLAGLNYQVQLLENISFSESQGPRESLNSDRARILNQLNDLCLEQLKRSFNEMCDLT